MDEILTQFPYLTPVQRRQLEMLGPLYKEWNERINVISRRDIDNIYPHHVLHSLAIGKFMTPAEGSKFMDLGTGGGFPGIPLAILWPECTFHMIDRIGKKLLVARTIAESIGLANVTFQHGDSSECHEKFDFVVSRAVMDLDKLVAACRRNVSPTSRSRIPNGLICLKGGDISAEIERTRRPVVEVPLTDWFADPYFEEKKLIYVRL